MRKLFPQILFLFFCAFVLLISACNSDSDGEQIISQAMPIVATETAVPAAATETSGLKITLPSSSQNSASRSTAFTKDDAASYDVSISSSSFSLSKTGRPGETIEFSKIPVAEYVVSVDAKNSSEEIIAWGSSTAVTKAGETALVKVKMNPLEYCTLSFDANGGEGTMNQTRCIVGKNFVLPACGFKAPSNKKFSAWAVKVNGEFTEAGHAGDLYSLEDDTTLYAMWTDDIDLYTVRFVDENGNEIKESQIVASGERITNPGNASKENFVFDDWYNGDKAFDITEKITSDLTLTAGFKPQQVTFSVAQGTVAYGTQVELSCATPGAVIYYKFGRLEIPDEDSPVYDGPFTINESTKINAIAVVPGYPKSDIKTVSYTVETVTLTFNSAYGNIPDPMTIPKNSPLKLPEISYYAQFTGWYIGENLATDGMLISENTTINATWNDAGLNILNTDTINSGNYSSGNLTDDMELCFDSSLTESAINTYFNDVLDSATEKVVVNMKYYTNSINSDFWIKRGIKKIIFPDNLAALYSMTFSESEDLEEIEISENNEYFSTEDGVLFDKGKTTLLRYPPSKAGTSYTLPDTVNSLGFVAFKKTKYLEEIPNFSIIQYMTEMDIFSYSSIKRLVVGSSVQSFGMYTFGGSNLEEIELPARLTTIGGESFSGCTNLTKVVFKGTTPPALSKPNTKLEFENTNASLQIFVPAGAKQNYLTAETWSDPSINALAERLNEIIVEQ